MCKDIFIKISYLILLLLLSDSQIAADSAQEAASEEAQFYYSEGSYFVTDDSPFEGCVFVPETGDGERTSEISTGGQCVKLYSQTNCQGAPLQAPTGQDPSFVYDGVTSFHLCSWEAPQYPDKQIQPTIPSTYSLYGFTSHQHFLLNATDVRGCINLPEFANNQVSSIKTYGNCLRLYQNDHCQGEMLEVGGTSLYTYDLGKFSFSDKASSIGPCPDDEEEAPGGSEPQISLHVSNSPLYSFNVDTEQGSLMIQYTDANADECKNFPEIGDGKVSSINTYGNCLRLYEQKNCKGAMQELNSTSKHHWYLDELEFSNKTSSIKLCGSSKLKAKITKFRFVFNWNDLLLGGTLNKVNLNSHTFINNETIPLSRTHEGLNLYKEIFVFEDIPSLRLMDSVEVDDSIRHYCGLRVPFIPELNLTSALKKAYGFQSGHESEGWEREIYKEFTAKKTFTVSSCSVNEVRLVMLEKENIPLEFEMELEVTGRIDNRGRVSTLVGERVRRRLPEDMEYLGIIDELKVMTKTRGRIFASVGIKTEVETLESTLTDCKKNNSTNSDT